jgi:hypothetical protein
LMKYSTAKPNQTPLKQQKTVFSYFYKSTQHFWHQICVCVCVCVCMYVCVLPTDQVILWQTPAGCSIIQFRSDTVYLKMAVRSHRISAPWACALL